jgi:hypothetical protein
VLEAIEILETRFDEKTARKVVRRALFLVAKNDIDEMRSRITELEAENRILRQIKDAPSGASQQL